MYRFLCIASWKRPGAVANQYRDDETSMCEYLIYEVQLRTKKKGYRSFRMSRFTRQGIIYRLYNVVKKGNTSENRKQDFDQVVNRNW